MRSLADRSAQAESTAGRPDQVGRPPQCHEPSSCSPRLTTGRCRYGHQRAQRRVQVCTQFGARRGGRRGQSPDDDVAARRKSDHPVPHQVPKTACHLVTHDRAADGLTDDETHPGDTHVPGGRRRGRSALCRIGRADRRNVVGSPMPRGRLGRRASTEEGMDDQPASPCSATPTDHQSEVLAVGQPVGRGQHGAAGGQADSRARPLRRRAATIARPARVRIRSRNPWVLARRRLLGWKVRLPLLTVGSPGACCRRVW